MRAKKEDVAEYIEVARDYWTEPDWEKVPEKSENKSEVAKRAFADDWYNISRFVDGAMQLCDDCPTDVIVTLLRVLGLEVTE